MRRREFVGGWIVTRPFAAVAQEAGRRVINCCADTTRNGAEARNLVIAGKINKPGHLDGTYSFRRNDG
jgi:hypothetical protein